MKKENRWAWLGRLGVQSGRLLAIGMLICLGLANIIFTAAFVTEREKPVFDWTRSVWLIFLVGLLVLTYWFYRWTRRLSLKWTYALLASVYLLVGAFFISKSMNILRADQWYCYQGMKALWARDPSKFVGKAYLAHYPNLWGTVIYDWVLSLVSHDPAWYVGVNLVEVIGINGLLGRLAGLLAQSEERNQTVEKMTMWFAFLFLPNFFFVKFIYGLIPGFFFLLIGYLGSFLYLKNGKVMTLLLAASGLSLAVILKQNFAIGILAIGIYLFLRFLQSPNWKPILLVMVTIVGIGLGQKGVKWAIEDRIGQPLGEGAPAVLWVAMGTDPRNRHIAAGWYNGFNYSVINEAKSKEEAAKIGQAKLKENWAYFKQHPKAAAYFFKEKWVSTWCEPTYQSILSGPTLAGMTSSKITHSVYRIGKLYWLIYYWNKALTILVVGLAVWFLYSFAPRKEGWLPLVLYWIGGFIFHTFWETKSQYVHTYIMLLMPLAAYSLVRRMEIGGKDATSFDNCGPLLQ